jgi:hypothetical protein
MPGPQGNAEQAFSQALILIMSAVRRQTRLYSFSRMQYPAFASELCFWP